MPAVNAIKGIGHRTINAVWRIGVATRFFMLTLTHSGSGFRRFHLIIKELFSTGVMSLIIIIVAGLFVGMVLGLQGYETLKRYGSESALGSMVALSLVRELGPVVAALLFASRAGSAMTAEIGLMRATEQISAMEMMAVNPIARIVAPRFWAGVISMPLLAALFSAVGVFGGYLVGVVQIGVDEGSFWSQMQAAVDFREDYGSESALGSMVALSLVRELGPVVAALLFASRAGSAMTAEIGLMRATEQISAMEMMAVNPIARIVAPRFWAGVISMPLLAALFSAVGVFGGYLVGVVQIGVDEGSFWSQMQAAVDFREDILNGVIKSFAFGIVVTVIALFEGYDAPPTAEGVSGATTRTVVTSSLAILMLDFVLTAIMFRGT
ncbi:MAG: hypothetical protein A2143_11025 [Gallionellales bacterium RBG_16_57_15]|nr:MAG: hypothetical protein A2143_11025 [Gallionellales bacterium RBG_16_57_15]